MIISLKHRFVLFAMPKCASHSLVAAIGDRADIILRNPPGAKHCNFRKYSRHLKGFLETFSNEPLDTLCLYREPEDWLNSWWRYRQRPALDGQRNSAKGIGFDEFVERVLDSQPPGDSIGRPSRFVQDREGGVGIDHLFRYEEVDRLVDWISDRTGWAVELDRLNVSPKLSGKLSDTVRRRMEAEMARDFEIYDQIGS